MRSEVELLPPRSELSEVRPPVVVPVAVPVLPPTALPLLPPKSVFSRAGPEIVPVRVPKGASGVGWEYVRRYRLLSAAFVLEPEEPPPSSSRLWSVPVNVPVLTSCGSAAARTWMTMPWLRWIS